MSNEKLFFCMFAVLFSIFSLQVHAGKDSEEYFSKLIYVDDVPVGRVELSMHDEFSMGEREMQYLIYQYGKNNDINNLCMVGYGFGSGVTEAVVFWKEENVLIRWYGGDPEVARERFKWASSIYQSIKIGEKNLYDRLPDPPYILGGDKRATRSGFYATIEDCERHGRQYRILPFTPPDDEDEP